MTLGAQKIRPAARRDRDQITQLISVAHADLRDDSGYYDAAKIAGHLDDAMSIGSMILVTEIDGRIVACGALSPAMFARDAWTLSFGATHPDYQGRGIGHALVQSRLSMAERLRAGSLLVSSKSLSRWARYEFSPVSRNPLTGSYLLVKNMGRS
jgi:N-acetylglutamate synthase-like GNAT family acetyltransferase